MNFFLVHAAFEGQGDWWGLRVFVASHERVRNRRTILDFLVDLQDLKMSKIAENAGQPRPDLDGKDFRRLIPWSRLEVFLSQDYFSSLEREVFRAIAIEILSKAKNATHPLVNALLQNIVVGKQRPRA